MNRLLTRSSAIIATSEHYINSSPVLRRFVHKCDIIPYGINRQSHCATHSVEEIRSRYPGPLILAVGRLVYYKGFEWLIRAMRHVEGNLIIIGEGPDRNGLEQIATEARVRNSVHLLGGLEVIAPYYNAADIFVLPSIATSEAFGIVQLEAMSCGKPVINTSIDTSVPYVSLHGVTGLTVPPKDEIALAKAINLLLRQPDLRHKYGQAARQRFLEEFTVDLMVERTAALYERLLTSPRIAAAYQRKTGP